MKTKHQVVLRTIRNASIPKVQESISILQQYLDDGYLVKHKTILFDIIEYILEKDESEK